MRVAAASFAPGCSTAIEGVGGVRFSLCTDLLPPLPGRDAPAAEQQAADALARIRTCRDVYAVVEEPSFRTKVRPIAVIDTRARGIAWEAVGVSCTGKRLPVPPAAALSQPRPGRACWKLPSPCCPPCEK